MGSRVEHWRARVRHVWRIPLADKWLYGETLVLLGAARAAILLVGFDRLERVMGERGLESTGDVTETQRRQAARVARSLRRISPHTPWTSNCFPQALVGAFLLRRRGVEPTVYLGARFSTETGELEAHAWLRAGERFVAGGDGSDYGQLIAYARPPS